MNTRRLASTLTATAATAAVALSAASAHANDAGAQRVVAKAAKTIDVVDVRRAQRCASGRVAVLRGNGIRCRRLAGRQRAIQRSVDLGDLLREQGMLGANGELVVVVRNRWVSSGCTNMVIDGRWYAACLWSYVIGNSGYASQHAVEWHSWRRDTTGWVSSFLGIDYY